MEFEFSRLMTCRTGDEANAVRELIARAKVEDIRIAKNAALKQADKFGPNAQRMRALLSVMADLITHGWEMVVSGKEILAQDSSSAQLDSRRDYVRRLQLGQREQQLRKPSVREFIRSMEKKRLGPSGWTSIFSLMRDGRELAASLRNPEAQLLPRVINPYIQVVEDAKQRCGFTGLRLMDIWRYFRYTWAMPYNSVPGRSMLILVRDAAAPNHPVIGIAALGSAIVQMSERDSWIGWTAVDFVHKAQKNPTPAIAEWVVRELGNLLDGVYKADLLKAGLISRAQLKNPSDETIARLRNAAEKYWALHRRFPHRSAHKSRDLSNKGFKEQALTNLFKAKRCETLAQLLQARKALNECGFVGDIKSLCQLAKTSSGRRALEILIRGAKAAHVGIDMLDITICGAIAPYNPILGGKLIAMLLCSPEITHAYHERYKDTPSIIASSMAGRIVRRTPRLVLLGTTSLYGERLNQYHRVQIPQGTAGAREAIRYIYKGESLGFGSSHLCQETVTELELMLAQSSRGRRVNSIFGEGVSPRLRKIRDGLDMLGLPSDRILNHGNPRLVYVIPLARNFREVLTGLERVPKFSFPRGNRKQVSSAIADFWGKRWLTPRLTSHPDAIDTVAMNDIRVPEHHAAKVVLPEIESEALPLFA